MQWGEGMAQRNPRAACTILHPCPSYCCARARQARVEHNQRVHVFPVGWYAEVVGDVSCIAAKLLSVQAKAKGAKPQARTIAKALPIAEEHKAHGKFLRKVHHHSAKATTTVFDRVVAAYAGPASAAAKTSLLEVDRFLVVYRLCRAMQLSLDQET
ncbi:Hypothetical protein, putative [Bodo saltans]|uniref:Uncharacterized protein n=1 Tax=Bodo saltans TaxID=75058 RepID=A0A0S4J2V7_BODSA|nr:Hypothetical protein, putative [Bodo saltans]|eukprot:CUG29076.1 Hypothetical protein, putative [Bodo saltans]